MESLRKAALLAALGCAGCFLGPGPAGSAGSSTGSGTGGASSSTGTTGGTSLGGAIGTGTGGISTGGGIGTTGGSTTGGSTTGIADAGAPAPVWVGIIGSGANLAVGVYGAPVLSTARKYGNLKLEDNGPDPRYAFDGGGLFSLVPIVEPIRSQPLPGWSDYQYPNNILGETPTHRACQSADGAVTRERWRRPGLDPDRGWDHLGHCIGDINKEGTGRAYPASLDEARAIAALAADAGRTLRYDGIVVTHGECDAYNLLYEAQLLQLWFDYNNDLRRITGQDGGVPLIETQQSAIDPYPDGTGSMLEQWQAGLDYPGQIICAGPKYQYAYAPDDFHLLASGYIRLGEKYAEVIAATESNRGWAPLQPTGITHVGNVVTVTLQDSFPPLSWDDNQPAGHQTANTAWAAGRGFEVTDLGSGSELPISSAEISGDDVILTLGFDPDAGALPDGGILVGYAMTGDTLGVLAAGQPAGRHGALRDSDPLVGIDAETLTVQVTQGSATISGIFNYRAVWDRVAPGELPKETVVLAVDPTSSYITLSNSWPGETGGAQLTFWHEQRNYCVDFQLSVP